MVLEAVDLLCIGLKTGEWTVLWREDAQIIKCYPDLTQSDWR